MDCILNCLTFIWTLNVYQGILNVSLFSYNWSSFSMLENNWNTLNRKLFVLYFFIFNSWTVGCQSCYKKSYLCNCAATSFPLHFLCFVKLFLFSERPLLLQVLAVCSIGKPEAVCKMSANTPGFPSGIWCSWNVVAASWISACRQPFPHNTTPVSYLELHHNGWVTLCVCVCVYIHSVA